MRVLTDRSLALTAFLPALVLFVFVTACGKQSEGERCGDDTYGPDSADCGDGLTCKMKRDLLDQSTTRCCYADGHVSDSRCEPSTGEVAPVGGAGGGSGAGALAGDSGSGGSSVAGGSPGAGGS